MEENRHIPANGEPGGQVAFKCIVVNGPVADYAIYVGPSDWTDAEVGSNGQKMSTETAKSLVYGLSFLSPQWYHMRPRV